MKTIDTAKKDWQREMEACMREGEVFEIQTKDRELARALAKGDMNVGVLRTILYGGATVAGVAGIAKVAAGTALAAAADPEPISKTILIIVAGVCFIVGCVFVYKLIEMLLDRKYDFTVTYEDPLGGTITITGKPVVA